MPFVALENCQIQDTVHQGTCEIQSGLSPFTTMDGKKVCLDGLKVLVSGGTVPGPQVAPVVVTINAAMITGTKVDDKLPLAGGEVSSGSETAQYTVGQSVVTAPVVLTISDAGQNDIQMT